MRSANWLLLALLLMLPCIGTVSAQEDDPAETGDAQLEMEGDEEAARLSGIDEIENILEADEDIFAGGGYTYDQGDRRDPFRSLRGRNRVALPSGPRPEGKAGLLVEELTLSGIFDLPEGVFAMVRGGPKDKSYMLQEGDQLYDGDVVSITPNEVVFKQIINDPAAIKPFREVVKRLDTK